MSEASKKQLLKSAERLTEVALDEVVAVAEVLAADSDTTVDDGVVSAVKLLRGAFLDSLVNKISDSDGD